MHNPSRKTFCERAERGNLIPVWRELLADQDTPLSAYERLRKGLRERDESVFTFLLESVEGGEHIGRYSFLGGWPKWMIEGRGRSVKLTDSEGNSETMNDMEPLDAVRQSLARYKPVPDPRLPRFFGGAVGFIGYDAVNQFERVPLNENVDFDWPDLAMAIVDTIIIFDRVHHTLKVVANAYVENDPQTAYDDAIERIDMFCRFLATPMPHRILDAHETPEDFTIQSNTDKRDFLAAVERAKEYIRAGDIIQTVLSQRFQVPYEGDPLQVYRALRAINPSPYMYCLEFGKKKIIGSSPEIHVRCEDGEAEVRPIAGTRPRSDDEQEDRRLGQELLADPKERAEHIMLVDLARNDLGRVCTYGSVKVPELMVIERYSHVMHIVSDVIGRLAPDQDIYDIMRATFPAGTVSGAPKIRAMEIIAELEKARRGPYAGAIGYFSFTGNLDSCITIRTILMEEGMSYIQAGAGIVADSDPLKEYEETVNKARAMLKAVALARKYDEQKVL